MPVLWRSTLQPSMSTKRMLCLSFKSCCDCRYLSSCHLQHSCTSAGTRTSRTAVYLRQARIKLKELCAQVCARCCLRFVGIRSSVYSQPAPSTESLCAALAARSHTASLKPENAAQRSSASEEVPKQTQNGVCNAFSPAEDVGSKKILTAPSTVDSEAATAERVAEQPETGNLNSNQHASDDAQLTLGEASSAEASRLEAVSSEGMPTSLPPCRVCLGVLQSLDGPVANLPSDAAEALPETDGCGGHCDPLSDGKMAAVADHIRSASSFIASRAFCLLSRF